MTLLVITLVVAISITVYQRTSKSPKLNHEVVMKLSDELAASKIQTFDNKNYPNRNATFSKKTKVWTVTYIQETDTLNEFSPSSWLSYNFIIYVYDETKKLQFVSGL